jgi:maltose phosphorylase
MNGEECHNEWEITFEEIHRNGAIAHGIYDYIRYTGDRDYMLKYGLEVLIAISRFWAQRVNWSDDKKAYVMLGVTGPNEYENNVNNNWYSNYIARWTLKYTLENIKILDEKNELLNQLQFSTKEKQNWEHIIEHFYFPKDDKTGLFLQQDGFLDKEVVPISSLDQKHRPLVENWSWDRILRSCYIKQADVLQGMYFFEDEFDKETIQRHFDFYEPITVHESSLSPCVHSIISSYLGLADKAYEFYLQTARLDLDDYNHDTNDGCHTTSMAGTWMAIVQGFGGMRIHDDSIIFNPFIPKEWNAYRFHVAYRESKLLIEVNEEKSKITNLKGNEVKVFLFGEEFILSEGSSITK